MGHLQTLVPLCVYWCLHIQAAPSWRFQSSSLLMGFSSPNTSVVFHVRPSWALLSVPLSCFRDKLGFALSFSPPIKLGSEVSKLQKVQIRTPGQSPALSQELSVLELLLPFPSSLLVHGAK